MPKHIAKWNPARDAWEDTRGGTSLFCGHSDVYSGTFPASGMTRNGVAYELRTWEHRTGDTGYSSSPNDEDDDAKFLPTPTASDGKRETVSVNAAANHSATTLGMEVRRLLPSPRTSDTNGPGHHGTGGMDLRTAVDLLPTPSVADGTGGHARRGGARGDELLLPGAAVEHAIDWGHFAPAINRWEQVLGRPSPPPTVPDGRNGKHRLSAPFVEWMMGLPAGWVTDVPITRNEQLKALGNGVVPQQCTAALRDMLAATTREAAA